VRRDLLLERLLPGAVWLAAFGTYALTTGPSIVALFDDTLEFQLVGPTFGIAHPTGYPLYVILSGLWSQLLPVGNWAWRMNLFSALCAATAVLLLFLLTRRLVQHADGRKNNWAGLAAVAAFGLGPVWTGQATVAEVYALHLLFVGAILNTAIGINRDIGTPRFNRRMTWLLLLCGLGLTHHRTTVLLAPGLLLYLLWSVPGLWRPRAIWLLWLGALLGPLLLYAWIPLRASMGVQDLNGSYVPTWAGFWDHVLARQYGTFFADNELAVSRTVRDWLDLAVAQFGVVALMLAVLGLAWLVDRQRRPVKAWIFVLVVLLTNLLFALNYRVGDVEVFLLPVFYCAAVFVGGGVGLVDRMVASRTLAAALQAGLILLVLTGLLGRGALTDRHREWAVHNYAVALAKVDFPAESRVIGLEGEMTGLKYMQRAEGLGRAAVPVVENDPTQRAALVDTYVAQGLPVYLTREVAGIETRYSFTGDGPLVRVWPRGESVIQAPTVPLNLPVGDEPLMLTGYDLTRLEQPGEGALRLTLHWLPTGTVTRDYKVSLRVSDGNGAPVVAADGTPLIVDAFPLRQLARTSQWAPDAPLTDVYYLPLPTAVQKDAATLTGIVYDAESVTETARWDVELQPPPAQ
jgi:hypothetical protein